DPAVHRWKPARELHSAGHRCRAAVNVVGVKQVRLGDSILAKAFLKNNPDFLVDRMVLPG
ncbi:hypothetical protein, partial [Aestuariivirga sp.]|uniref:hypothetical protein n=1 Tax=Aestuariivirga sp. TaxID=2650926 RepID=UPI00301A06BF